MVSGDDPGFIFSDYSSDLRAHCFDLVVFLSLGPELRNYGISAGCGEGTQ